MSAFPEAGIVGYWPFENLPECPDSAAGKIYLSPAAWATGVDGWSANGAQNTVSIDSGKLKVAYSGSSGNSMSILHTNTSMAGKMLILKVSSSVPIESVKYYNGSTYISAILNMLDAYTAIAIIDNLSFGAYSYLTLSINQGNTVAADGWFHWIYVGTAVYTTKATDESYRSKDMTCQGVTSLPGKSGNALRFNGVNGQCVYTITYWPAMFTISAWIKTPGLASGMTHNGIFDLQFDVSLYINSLGRAVFLTLGPSNLLTQPSGNLYDNAWHFIEAVYDGTTKKLRVDGVLVASIVTAMTYTAANNFTIGTYTNDPSVGRFFGLIDEVRLYNLATTDAQGLVAYQEVTPQHYAMLGYSPLEDVPYLASWTDNLSFDYLAGTTLSLTATLLGTIPLGTEVLIYAGETLATLELVANGVKEALLFLSTVSGPTNLYIRLVLWTSSRWLNPVVSSLDILIHQETSLYTIATQILADGLTPSNTSWNVDRELQKYPIPYAWFDPVKHRYAIGKVAEAAGGVVYQDRLGVIQVEAGNFLTRDPSAPSLFTIIAAQVYDASSPVSTIRNRIQIRTNPYVKLAETTVWTLTGDTKIDAGESRAFDVLYSDYDAVLNGHAVLSSTPSGASITSETHYSWGATIVVLGSANDQELSLVVHGEPLAIQGSQLIERTDGASIRRNGDRALTIDGNNMIQSEILAAIIADDILAVTKDGQRDIEIDWRGDPTIELGDIGTVLGFRIAVITQEILFDGILRGVAQVRKVN